MKKTMVLLAVLLSCAAVATAEPDAHPDTTGWETLFTGDLSDATFPEGVWSIKDGQLSATKDECIWTKKQYEKFTLDLEFKTTEGANSGVIIYCTDLANWIPTAIEIQLLDDHAAESAKYAKNWQCAAIFGRLAPTKSMVKKPGEWNRMTIDCNGQHISVTLNGELVTKMDMSKWTSATKNLDGSDVPAWINKEPLSKLPTKGHIGLQGKHAGVPTFFRNVKIKQN